MTVSADSLPDVVKQVIANQQASHTEIMHAAQVAEAAKFHKLANALRERAEVTPGGGNATVIESPWKDTPSPAWTRFCRIMSEGNGPDKISPRGFFGLFQLSVRRLCDLGIMRGARARNVRLPNGQTIRVWEGQWILPQRVFLGDPRRQYETFRKSMELYRSIVAEKYKQVLGLPIEGQPATLSGLLALMHMAGSEGAYKWLTEGPVRRRFTWVTEAFLRANGIF